jgi:hypothetical protein
MVVVIGDNLDPTRGDAMPRLGSFRGDHMIAARPAGSYRECKLSITMSVLAMPSISTLNTPVMYISWLCKPSCEPSPNLRANAQRTSSARQDVLASGGSTHARIFNAPDLVIMILVAPEVSSMESGADIRSVGGRDTHIHGRPQIRLGIAYGITRTYRIQ